MSIKEPTITRLLKAPIAAALLLVGATAAHSAEFIRQGNISYHNDIVQFDFSLATAGSNVRVWSDSWLSGVNFDPTAALWAKSGSDYGLLQAVDDDDTVGPGSRRAAQPGSWPHVIAELVRRLRPGPRVEREHESRTGHVIVTRV